MKKSIQWSVLIIGLLTAVSAQARRVENAAFSLTPEVALVELHTDARLEFPRIRITEGRVRFWFPEMASSANIRQDGDRRLVHSLRVHSGEKRTTVLDVQLAVSVLLDKAEIHVDATADDKVRILIARAPLEHAAPAPMAAQLDPRKSEQSPAESGQSTQKAAAKTETSGPSEPKEAATASQTATASTTEGSTEAKQSTAATQKDKKAQQKIDQLRQSSTNVDRAIGSSLSSSANVNTMLGISALLLLAFVGTKLYGKQRKSIDIREDIDVIAHRRLGPKHQLVLVRALDHDYLLSVNGQQTQRIAKLKHGQSEIRELRPKQATNRDLLEPADQVDRETHLGHDERSDRSDVLDFRDELARQRSRRTARTGQSEAVQGLLRLRERIERAAS